jgi:peptide/nickel transport system ATP-binding protein
VSGPILTVENLTVRLPARDGGGAILEEIAFEIASGEVLALVGESGCGKSMTALSLMRLVPKPLRLAENTRVMFDGHNIMDLSVPRMRALRGASISMIFQDPATSLNPVRTVGDQVSEGVRLHEKVNPRTARARVIEIFERTGIPDPASRFDAYPHQLSGGLKQRVLIAMALIMKPKILIADEPTTALDVTVQAQILELLRELRRDLGTAIVLIAHDLGVVNELADRVAVMYGGRIVEQGTRHELLKDPRHPYTQGLLRAIPSAGRRGEALQEMKGLVPLPGQGPMGCRFTARCPRAFEPCADIRPRRSSASVSHVAWCHALEDVR